MPERYHTWGSSGTISATNSPSPSTVSSPTVTGN
jgi:hypothetical protein